MGIQRLRVKSVAWVERPRRGRLTRLHDGFNLHRVVARQRLDADGTARVLPGITENLDHQVGKAVDDSGRVGEPFRSIDEADDLYDPLYVIEAAQCRPHGGQQNEAGLACRLLTLFDREFLADLPLL